MHERRVMRSLLLAGILIILMVGCTAKEINQKTDDAVSGMKEAIKSTHE